MSKGWKSCLNRFFNRQNFEQKQVVQNYKLKSYGIVVFAEESMTCFCSAPGCGNWLKTISQKQISFTVYLRSQTV
jgi:hypothetical protein